MDAQLFSAEIADMDWIDSYGEPIQRLVSSFYDVLGVFGKGLRRFLNSEVFGLSWCSVIVSLPFVAWIVATILDIVGFWSPAARHGADRSILVGVILSVPAIWAGLSDWASHRDESVLRIAGFHGLVSFVALIFYSASLLYRLSGGRFAAVLTGSLGFVALAMAIYVGRLLSIERAEFEGASFDSRFGEPVPVGQGKARML